MRTAIAVAVLLVAVVALANPVATQMSIDFDPPNMVNYLDNPPLYTPIPAYVVADFSSPGQDVYAVHFDLRMLFGVTVITGDFVPAEPTYTVQIVDNGITVISEDCFGPVTTLGYLPITYLGTPDILMIRPHAYNGSVFILCNTMEEHEYCTVLDGGLGMEPAGPYDICESPVEDIGWGAIKAMYR